MSSILLSPKFEVIASVIAYSFCSGSLVLLNKLILHHLGPFPSLVVSFQLVATLIFIYGAKATGMLSVDAIVMKHVIPYLYYIIAFAAGVYCNMKSLSLSNVETVIVFRALAPVLVAVLDAIFLGREYPSPRSWCGLGLIVLGAYGYASFDPKFKSQGISAYTWPFMYLIIISFEMAYGKKIIRSVDLKTKSGPVLYTNLLGLTPMLIFAGLGGEYGKFATAKPDITFGLVCLVFLSCAVGTGIGYSSWWCRDKISATSFTMLGVMNKCFTILLNLMIWDQHAPPGGILSLLLCLVGGVVYKQAPMRVNHNKVVAEQADEVWKDDLTEEDHHDDVEAETVQLLEKGMKRRS